MNQTETNAFFHALHEAEDAFMANVTDPEPEWTEAYDYVMDMVKDAILSGEAGSVAALDGLINQIDSYTGDYEAGPYAGGYEDATNLCLQALDQLNDFCAG